MTGKSNIMHRSSDSDLEVRELTVSHSSSKGENRCLLIFSKQGCFQSFAGLCLSKDCCISSFSR